VVVLIDEVESLTAARAGAMAGTEPSDGLRVVNALLTQLDKLKHRRNVLVMATSNLVKAIDTAFVDRADIIQYVHLPSREAIYDIIRSSLCEMALKGVLAPIVIPTLKQVQIFELVDNSISHTDAAQERQKKVGLRLLALATRCQDQGMSGRALRRLPVLALARYIGMGHMTGLQFDPTEPSHGVAIELWLDGLELAVNDITREKEIIA